MRKQFVLAILCISLLSFTTIDETILSDKDKQNSIFFKMSRNSNRIAVFEQLQANFRIKTYKSKFGANQQSVTASYSTIENVIEVLGEPDVRVNSNSFVYTLNPKNGCKAIIEFDNIKMMIFIGIKDCN